MVTSQDTFDDPVITSGKRVQIMTSIILNILGFGAGASFGIPNVLLSQLDPKVCWCDGTATDVCEGNITAPSVLYESSDLRFNQSMHYCQFTINCQKKALIANSGIIGLYFTLFLAVSTVSRFGKRVSLMIDCVLFLMGFGLMASATNIPMLCVAKVLLGYASLTSRASIQPFISEICDPAIRGTALTFNVVSHIMGQSLSILAASRFPNGWRYVSGVLGVWMIICFLSVMLWVHETPDWLLEDCRFEEATESLKFYKTDRNLLIGDDEKRKTINGEEKGYEDIVAMYREEWGEATRSVRSSDETPFRKIKGKLNNVVMKMKQPEVYKPFIFLSSILGLLELSGFAVMANFSIHLIEEYGYEEHKTFINASDFMVVIYLSRIPISFLAIPLLKKMRKRPLFLIVSIFLLIILTGIVVFTHYATSSITKENFQNVIGLQIVPLILFILFYAAFSFGSGSIPFAMMGELFPPNASVLGNTFVFIVSNSCAIIAIRTALAINENHGLEYVFLIPTGAVAASVIIAGIFMPETKGLSANEIRDIYGRSSVEIEVKVPYYHRLSSELAIESRKDIKRRQSVYLLSPEILHGIIEHEDIDSKLNIVRRTKSSP